MQWLTLNLFLLFLSFNVTCMGKLVRTLFSNPDDFSTYVYEPDDPEDEDLPYIEVTFSHTEYYHNNESAVPDYPLVEHYDNNEQATSNDSSRARPSIMLPSSSIPTVGDAFAQGARLSASPCSANRHKYDEYFAMHRYKAYTQLAELFQIIAKPPAELFKEMAELPDELLFHLHHLYRSDAYFHALEARPGFYDYILDLQEKAKEYHFRKTLRYTTGFEGKNGFNDFLNEYAERIKHNRVRHQEINNSMGSMRDDIIMLNYDNLDNDFVAWSTPINLQLTYVTEHQTNIEIKEPLSRATQSLFRVSQGVVYAMKDLGLSGLQVATFIAEDLFDLGKTFLYDLPTAPVHTLRSKIVEPLGSLFYYFGQASYLALVDQQRFCSAGAQVLGDFISLVKNNPERAFATGVQFFYNPLKAPVKHLSNIKELSNALEKCKKVLGPIKHQASNITRAAGKSIRNGIRFAREHYDHLLTDKNSIWAKVVKDTKRIKAKFKMNINVETIAWDVWETGIVTNSDKMSKVKKFNDIMGASNGKETPYVIVKYSAKTIHAHPITEEEFRRLTKVKK